MTLDTQGRPVTVSEYLKFRWDWRLWFQGMADCDPAFGDAGKIGLAAAALACSTSLMSKMVRGDRRTTARMRAKALKLLTEAESR